MKANVFLGVLLAAVVLFVVGLVGVVTLSTETRSPQNLVGAHTDPCSACSD